MKQSFNQTKQKILKQVDRTKYTIIIWFENTKSKPAIFITLIIAILLGLINIWSHKQNTEVTTLVTAIADTATSPLILLSMFGVTPESAMTFTIYLKSSAIILLSAATTYILGQLTDLLKAPLLHITSHLKVQLLLEDLDIHNNIPLFILTTIDIAEFIFLFL